MTLMNNTAALALNTATLGHNLEGYGAGWETERVIDACAARGFGGIVFWRREIGDNPIRIGNRVRDADMSVAGLCRSPYIVGSEKPIAWKEETLASIDMAAALGTSILTVVSGGTEPGTKGVEESQKILAERLSQVVDHAAACGVKLALEPLNPMFGGNRTCLMQLGDAIRVCDAIGSSNIGIAVDVYHVWWDTQLATTCSEAGNRILGLHLCDWLENTTDMLLDRGMMGDGVADIKGIRELVEKAGYTGFCEVEIFSANNWWRRSPDEVLDTIVDRFISVC